MNTLRSVPALRSLIARSHVRVEYGAYLLPASRRAWLGRRFYHPLAEAPKNFGFVSPEELNDWVSDPAQRPGLDYLVVDVRETDYYAKGHIPGAINLPSSQILPLEDSQVLQDKTVAKLLLRQDRKNESDSVQLEHLPRHLIFHCQLSLIRGPSMTTKFLRAFQSLYPEREGPPELELLDPDSDEYQQAFDGIHSAEEDESFVSLYILKGGYKEWSKFYKVEKKP